MEKGICKDDKVLVQMPNRISFVAVLFALAKIRTVPIMMLPAHREAELEGIIALAKPTAYVVAERYLGFSYVEMAMNMQKNSHVYKMFLWMEYRGKNGMSQKQKDRENFRK